MRNVKNDIISRLTMLAKSFDEYFSAGEPNCFQHWIINLLLFDLSKMPDYDNLKEDLIEMKSCQRLQLLFDKLKLENFWCAAMKAFLSLAMNTMTGKLPFLTAIFVKVGFRQ